MNKRSIGGSIALTAAIIALSIAPAIAQRGKQSTRAGGPSPRGEEARAKKGKGATAEQIANAQARIAAATAILNRLEPDAKRLGLAQGWRQSALDQLLPLSLDALRQVDESAVTLEAMTATVSALSVEPTSLGEATADLVYTPIIPCRYIDTRFAGGKIGGQRGFDLFDDGGTYGGSGACDPLPMWGLIDENDFGAIAMNVTVVDTSTAGAPGYLAVKPAAGSPTTSLINWYNASTTVQVANQGIVTTDHTTALNEFVVETSGPVHVIVDLFGAFITPEATALQVTSVTTDWSITGLFFNVVATCPAGYAITGGGWNHDVGNFDGISATQSSRDGNNNGWRCRGWHTAGAGTTQAGYCEAICARVPGR